MGITLVSSQYTRQFGLSGALILDVTESSPAELAGLRPTAKNRNGEIELGDIIIAIDDEKISSNNDLLNTLEKYAPDDTISVTYDRNGRKKAVQLTLASSVNI